MGTIPNTWRLIRRSPYQAIAAVLIMTLTFIVGGLFLILSLGSSMTLKFFEQKPQIIVFFQDTKKEADILKLVDQLKQNPTVASVKYVTKQQALEIYKEQYRDDPMLLEMVSADILPASIEVSSQKIETLAELAKQLKKEADTKDIIFPEDVVNVLVAWVNTIRTVGLIMVILLATVSLFTVMTVVGMKIAFKREEIEIVQLVGATRGYIRMPFILEGAIYGIVGSMIGWGINVGLLFYASPYLATLFRGIIAFPISPFFYVYFFLGMVCVGAGLGITASFIAINRFIR